MVAIAPYKQDKINQSTYGDLEMSALNCSFVVHAIRRMKHHKWRTKKFVFDCPTSSLCQQWIETVQLLLASKKILYDSYCFIMCCGSYAVGIPVVCQSKRQFFSLHRYPKHRSYRCLLNQSLFSGIN